MERVKQKNMKKKGFTLIELLVVIAIIGILSSVVVVSLNSARAKARDAKRIADIGEIQKALVLYADSNAMAYPDALADLVPTYFPATPVGPNASETYSYAVSADGLNYHLGTTLEQITAGTGVLATDRDCTSGATPTCTGFSVAAATGFAGTDPVFDVTN